MAGYLRKIQRYGKSHDLARRITAGITAAGFFVQPFMMQAVQASEIEKVNGGALSSTDGVYDILADKVIGDNAINVFNKFTLDEGNIANMYFGTEKSGNAANLVNFVNEHIHVNGTVNAIRNGNIGGNLYFVSIDGMTVGAKGVINAGSINIVTPTSKDYNDLLDQANENKLSEVTELERGRVSINPEGTISVAGHLNAVDGITLQAANIELHNGALLKTAATVDFTDIVNTTKTNADGTTTDISAGLGNNLTAEQTGTGDIVLSAVATSYATAPSEEKDTEDLASKGFTERSRTASIKVNEGATIDTSETKAHTVQVDEETTKDYKGAITLSAEAINSDEGWYLDDSNTANFINPLGRIVKTTATVDVNGTLNSADKIDVTANASNEYNSWNDTAKWSDIKNDAEKILGFSKTLAPFIDKVHSTLNVDVNFSYLTADAKVNIGKTAKLTAQSNEIAGAKEGQEDFAAMHLTATSTTKNIVQASSTNQEPVILSGNPQASRVERTDAAMNRSAGWAGMAAAAVGTDSNAEVNVNGHLEAKGTIAVKAMSTDAIVAKSTENCSMPTQTSTEPYMNFALVLATGENHAKVEFGEGSVVKSTDGAVDTTTGFGTGSGNVQAVAVAANSIDVAATDTSSTKTEGSSALAIYLGNSDATVNMNGTVSADKAVVANATNKTTRHNITASNSAAGAPTAAPELSEQEAKNFVATERAWEEILKDDNGEIQKAWKKASKKIKEDAKADETAKECSERLSSFDSMFTAGGSLALNVEDNTANVNVGNTATLKGKAAKISATTDLADTHVSALSSMQNKNPYQDTKAYIDGAAAISVIDNKANVTIADGEEEKGKHATIIGGGMVDIKAASTQEYDRFNGLKDDCNKIYGDFQAVIDACKDIAEEVGGEHPDFDQILNDFGVAYQKFGSFTNKMTGTDLSDYTGDIAPNLGNGASIILELLSGAAAIEQWVNTVKTAQSVPSALLKNTAYEAVSILKHLEGQALMFVTPEKYANFAASADVGTVDTGNFSIGLAGAGNANVLRNDAEIYVGKNAVLTSGAGSVSLESDAKQTTVEMNGKVAIQPNPEAIIKIVKDMKEKWGNITASDYETWLSSLIKKGTDNAPNVAGGTLGIAQHYTTNTITVAEGAKLTGKDSTRAVDTGKLDENDNAITEPKDFAGVTILADNQNITTDISFSAGKSGTAGFEGLFSWMGGVADNHITIDPKAVLTASRDDSKTVHGVDVEGKMNVIGTNLVGAIAWGSGAPKNDGKDADGNPTSNGIAVSVGAADAMTYYDIDNIVNVGGKIDARDVSVNALTDGVINTITVAGAVTSTKPSKSTATSAQDTLANDTAVKEVEKKGNDDSKKVNDKTNDNVNENTANGKKKDTEDGKKTQETNPAGLKNQGGNNTPAAASAPVDINVSGAGSASVNIIDAKTEAKLSNAVLSHDEGTHVNVKAEDASFIGAWSGAAAMNWKQSPATVIPQETKEIKNQNTTPGKDTPGTTDENGQQIPKVEKKKVDPNKQEIDDKTVEKTSGYNAALAGAAAINSAKQTVNSEVSDVSFTGKQGLSTLKNIAQKDGALVAAGLSVSALKENATSSAASFAGAGSISVNVAQDDVTATIKNVEDKAEGTELDTKQAANYAMDSDTQVTGGVNMTLMFGGKLNAGVGGSLAIGELHNNVKADVDGLIVKGKKTNFYNDATTELTQVTTAIGLSASGGAKTNVNFNGALAGSFNQNDVRATVNKADLTGEIFENKVGDSSDLNKFFDETIANNGVDPTGGTYMENATNNAASASVTDSTDESLKSTDLGSKVDEKMGSENDTVSKSKDVIVTTALDVSLGLSKGGVGGSGAAAVAAIHNDKTASVKNSTITMKKFLDEAYSDALLVNVAGGVSATGGVFSGAGSVSVQSTENDVLAEVGDSTITVTGSDGMKVSAETKDLDINVAGQVSAGQNAAGMALAVNHLDNDTEAYLRGSTIDLKETAPLAVMANNSGEVYSVAAAVGGAQTAAVQGAVAVNQGKDNVLAIVDKSTNMAGTRTSIKDAKSVTVSATDTGTKVAVAGGLSGAGTAAVGGGVAYNEIGSWVNDDSETEENEKHQQVKAALRHTDITNTNSSAVSVTAEDREILGTAAAGIGGAGTAAVQGAAATSVIARETKTEVIDTKMNDGKDGKASLAVKSTSDGSIYNNAVVVAGSGTAAIGAGVAVNYDGTDTTAKVSGGTYNVSDMVIEAVSKEKMLNIGIGGTGSGVAAITGSVAVNVQAGDTTAQLGETKKKNGMTVEDEPNGKTTVDSTGSVIVAAQSDRAIDNLAGTFSVGGEGAAVGLSVAVSDIQSSTNALVEGAHTSIKADGKTLHNIEDKLADGALIHMYADSVDSPNQYAAPAEYMERDKSGTNYSGIAVSASATNKISSYSVNMGGVGVGGAVNGTVNVSTIGGTTTANVTGEKFEAGKDLVPADIHVNAKDYANNTSFGGAGNLAGIGGNVGLSSTTLTINRKTDASFIGADKTTASAKGANIGVSADSGYGIGSMNVGVAFNGVGGSVGNVDNVTLLKGTTSAMMANFNDVTLSNSLDVTANRRSQLYTMGITGGVGGLSVVGGLGVDVVQDKSSTEAWLSDSKVKLARDKAENVTVRAKNSTEDNYQMYAANAAGLGGLSGTVSVGNFDSSVSAQMNNSTIGEESGNRAFAVKVQAENTTVVTPATWNATAGGAGLGLGVQIATSGTSVKAAATGSNIYSAGNIDILATDSRKADLLLGNTMAAIASGALNVGVLTVNNAVSDTYSYMSDEGTSRDVGVDMAESYQKANDTIDGNKLQSKYTYGWSNTTPTITASRGMEDGQQPGGTVVDVSRSKLVSDGNVTVKGKESTNLTETSINAAVGGVNLNGSVGILNTTANTSLKADDATISAAGDITFETKTDGTSELNLYMGSCGSMAANGAVGVADASANNDMSMKDSSLKSLSGDIKLSAINSSKSVIHSYAVTASTISGAIQVADIDMGGKTELTLDHVTTEAKKDKKGIFITAKNAPTAEAKTGQANASLAANAGTGVVHVGVGTKDAPLETNLTVKNKSAFIAPSVSLGADADVSEIANLMSLSGAVGETILTDVNHVYDYSNVSVDVDESTYGDSKTQADVSIQADNVVEQRSYADGYDGSLLASLSNNVMKTKTVLNTSVNAKGSLADSSMKGVSLIAATSADNESRASTFGGGVLAEGAAVLRNTLTTDTKTELSGTWNVDGDMLAAAVNKETLMLKADSSSATIVNGSGAGYTDTTTENASVKNKAVVTTTGSQNYDAGIRANNSEHILASGFGAIAGVSAGVLTQTHTYTNSVDFSNATLSANGEIKASAATLGSMDSQNHLDAGAGGLEVSVTDSTFNTTFNNSINAAGSKLTTNLVDKEEETAKGKYTNVGGFGGDIDLAAYDDMRLSFDTIAKSEGILAGVATSSTTNNLTRTNQVQLDSSSVSGAGNVGLYANRNINGAKTGTVIDVLSDSYNRTFLGVISEASITSTIQNTNYVNVNKDSSAQGVGDVKIAADNGKDSISQSSTQYRWFTDCESDGTTKVNGDDSGLAKPASKNSVDISGSVTAGTHNKAEVEITGDVKISGNEKDGYKANMDNIQVTVKQGKDWLKSEAFTKGSVTLVNGYYDRYEELCKMIKSYNSVTDEYKAYQTELNALCEIMVKAGFAVKSTTNSNSYLVAKQREAAAIVVPNMTVSGGNIEIESDKLNVTGNVTANGSPEITITNASPTYLYVNDVIIENAGGDVTFNGKSFNAETPSLGMFGAERVATNTTGDGSGNITISNTCGSTSALNQPDIGIYGKVANKSGDVTISSDKYSIYVDKNATVSGMNVYLKADQGAVTQSNPNGIIMIGTDPVVQYMLDHAEDIQKALDVWLSQGKTISTFKTYTDYVNWVKSAEGLNINVTEKSVDASAGIIANDSIFISGHEVNIGGLVQSGYDTYSVELNSDAADKIASLDNEWAKSPVLLTAGDVMSGDTYLVSKKGSYYDSKAGCYQYHVAVYYNPATQQLLVDDVKASGGQIYITGNIGSTGNGKILAVSGIAKMAVDTTAITNRELVLNNITNSRRNGYINITDTLQNRVFEYANSGNSSGAKARDYEIGKDAGEWTEISNNTFNPFKPKQSLTYQWTGGVTGETVDTFEYTTTEWLSCIDYDSPTEMKAHMSDEEKKNIKTVSSTTNPNSVMDTSNYLTAGNNGDNTFTINGQYSTHDKVESEVEHDVDKFGFGFIYKEIKSTWTETYGTASTTTYSVKADNDVAIGFRKANNISSSDSPAIDVKAGGNLIIGGDITSASHGDYVGLVSKNGSISGGGTVVTNNLKASAATGIDLIQTAKKAQNSNGSSISTYVDLTSTDGSISLDSKKGDIKIWNVEVKNASLGTNINIHAADSILSDVKTTDSDSVNPASVRAAKITLISDHGSIGTQDEALRIQAGSAALSGTASDASVTASAQDGIYLKQKDGDMRVNHIESKNGDVELYASTGSIIDASDETAVSNTPSKIQSWIDAGLISSDDSADSKTNAAKAVQDAEKTNIEKRFTQLAKQENGHTVAEYEQSAGDYNREVKEARDAYIQALQSVKATDTEKADAKAAYEAAQQDFFDDKGYNENEQNAVIAYAEVTREGAEKSFGWTKNELLYAVKSSVVNSEPGKVSLLETANVKGHNVKLHAAGIGADGEIQVINKEDIKNHLVELSQAHVGGVTKTYNEDGTLKSITLDTRQPLTYEIDDSDSANKGKLTVDTKGHVYLATTTGKAMQLEDDFGSTSQDVMLYAGKGIESNGKISAKDLTMYAGDGNIGQSVSNPLDIVAAGLLTANSGESIYLNQQDNSQALTLRAISAGKDVEITAANDILMETGNNAVGYINAGNEITLKSTGGNIGSSESAIRVLNNDVVINAKTGDTKGTYLSGESTGANGDYVLGMIQTGTLEAENETGDVRLSRAANAKSGKSALKAVVAVKAASTISAQNIDLTDGHVTSDGGVLTLVADNSITQKDTTDSVIANGTNGSITLQTGTENAAGGSIDIASKNNTFDMAAVKAADADKGIIGDITVISNAADGLTVSFGEGDNALKVTSDGSKKLRDVVIQNTASDGGDLTLEGKLETTDKGIAFTSSGKLTENAELTSAKRIVLVAKDDITVGKDMTSNDDMIIQATDGKITLDNASGKLSSTNGGINIKGNQAVLVKTELAAENGGIVLESDKASVGVTKALTADTVNLTAGDSINLMGDVNAAALQAKANGIIEGMSDLTITNGLSMAGTTVTLTGNTTAGNAYIVGKDVSLTAGDGKKTDVSGMLVVSTTGGNANITKTNAGSMHITSAMTGNDTSTGNIHIGSGVTAKDAVSLTAENSIDIGSNLQVKDLYATAGQNIILKDDGKQVTTAAGDLTLDAGNTLELGGVTTVTAGGDLTLHAGTGELRLTKAEAGNGLDVSTGSGNATIDTITAGGNVRVTAGSGNLEIGTAASTRGNVTIATGSGSVNSNGEVTAAGKATLSTSGGTINAKGTVTAGSIDLIGTGSITAANLKSAGETLIVSNGGDVKVDKIDAGSMDAVHRGTGSLNLEDTNVHGSGSIVHMGNGNINLGTLDVGREMDIAQLGNGEINATGALKAGQPLELMTKNGDMNLTTVDGGNRLMILNYGKDKWTRAEELKANELITIYSRNQDIDEFDSQTVLDILLVGDQTREAVADWRGAAEMQRRQQMEEVLGGEYTFHYDLLSLGSLIDFRPWRRSIPKNADAAEIEVEDDNEQLLKALS